MSLRVALFLTVAACVLAPAGLVDGGTLPGDRYVKARLVTETREIAAGGSGYLGVHLRMEAGWHVYWRFAGDAGAPVALSFTAPAGVTLGDPEWPAPVRSIEGGELLNYVYEKEVLLLVPVEVDSSVEAGSLLPIDVSVEWLVCKEYCVPGAGRASVSVRVGDDASPTADRDRFAASRRRLPRPWKEALEAGVTASWKGRELSLRASGASELEFYPLPWHEDDERLPESGMLESGRVRGERLVLEYGEDVVGRDQVLGVLSVLRGEETAYYSLDIAGPEGP